MDSPISFYGLYRSIETTFIPILQHMLQTEKNVRRLQSGIIRLIKRLHLRKSMVIHRTFA